MALPQQCRAPRAYRKHDMAAVEGVKQMDVILFQRIRGGWEYEYSSDGETYRGFDYDPAKARARLLRMLGWDQRRFDDADFRRF
jgi:hypothetical protein